jgi:hypothetical protein
MFSVHDMPDFMLEYMVGTVAYMSETCIMGDGIVFGHWGFDRHAPGGSFGPRRHHDHDLILIQQGEVVWEVDGVAHPAPAPSLLIARPGLTDILRWDPRRESRNLYIHVDLPPSVCAGLPPPERWPLVRRLPRGDAVRPLLMHAAWLLERRPAGWQMLAGSAIVHCLRAAVLGQVATAGSTEARLHPLVERIVAMLTRRWRGGLDRLGAAEMAAAAGPAARPPRAGRDHAVAPGSVGGGGGGRLRIPGPVPLLAPLRPRLRLPAERVPRARSRRRRLGLRRTSRRPRAVPAPMGGGRPLTREGWRCVRHADHAAP